MDNHVARKRRRASSNADSDSEAGSPKRVQRTFTQPASSVRNATATGSARMLNGPVHGDNIHGNVSTTINNFHAGSFESSRLDMGPGNSGTLSASERKELMECLRFPQLDARLTNLRKAESQTCDWIVQRKDYKKWLESDGLNACDGFFWIKGNPGTGKSITMKFLYQKMQRQLRNAKSKDKSKNKLVIAFFFNAHGNKFEKSTLGLYRSLLFSLFTLEPNLQEALDHVQRSGYHSILESEWQLQMLKEVFEEAITLLQAQEKKLYCYVDALDECPEDDVQDMVSYFEDLVASTNSRNCRVCFSSRHYPQISIRTQLTMTLEKEGSHHEDIRIFIESQLRFEEDTDPELLRQIRAEILAKSSGIFLWVNLVVLQLNEVQRQDGRMKAVQQRLRDIPEAAKQRPAPNGAMSLYGLFQDIIQKDERNIDELVRIAQIVFCARRPLNPKELYVLLHRQYDVPFDSSEASDNIVRKHVTEVSKGLAEVTKSAEPTVQFIHETVREFLRDGGLKNISTQSIDGDGHETLKMSCLDQIHAPVSEHLELLADYRLRGHYRDTKVNKITKSGRKRFLEEANEKFPFLAYASENLLFHADEAEAMGISQSGFLESFPMAKWVPIYNCFQKHNTRRYDGTTTTILYILAEHCCDHLIRSSPGFMRQYAQEIKGNECRSAFACAIYRNHLDTAWTLAGLEAKSRHKDIVAPRKNTQKSSVVRLAVQLGDAHLMRKVLEDWHVLNGSVAATLDFELVKSAEMIDVFLEVSMVPEFPSVRRSCNPPRANQEAPQLSLSDTDLPYIRRAIKEKPSLLKLNVWGRRTMLDYAVDQSLESLVSLYLEYSGGHQSDLNAVLHRAAEKGLFAMVKFAHQHNGNLGYQNEDGQTALHLAAEHYGSSWPEIADGKLLQYLLSEEPACVNVRDCQGQTALGIALQNHTDYPLLKSFVQAGADLNIEVQCNWCEKHSLTPAVALAIHYDETALRALASYDRCNLDGRDSFGRTALSWCFVRPHRSKYFDCGGFPTGNLAHLVGRQLLLHPAVDVNSRDDSSYTILEHFIRNPYLFRWDKPTASASFVQMFLHHDRLDPNLRTSNDLSHLELIVSLYDTWPDEFGGVGTKWESWFDGSEKCRERWDQQAFNQHLFRTLKLLLETGKVDINVQRHCAKEAPPELKSIILDSIEFSFFARARIISTRCSSRPL